MLSAPCDWSPAASLMLSSRGYSDASSATQLARSSRWPRVRRPTPPRPTSRLQVPSRKKKRPLPNQQRQPSLEGTVAEVSLELIKELRDRTGAGIMDCKRALEESSGNIDKA